MRAIWEGTYHWAISDIFVTEAYFETVEQSIRILNEVKARMSLIRLWWLKRDNTGANLKDLATRDITD